MMNPSATGEDLPGEFSVIEKVADFISYPIIIVDDTGSVLLWNRAAERVFLYTREEAVGAQVQSLIAPPERVAFAAEGLRRFAKDGQGIILGRPVEMKALRKDGCELTVEMTVHPFEFGGRFYALAALVDVTEERKREVDEREREMLFRRIVEGVREGIVIIKDGIVRYVNPALTVLSGYRPEEVVGRPFVEFVHPDERDKVADRYRRRMAGEDVETTYRTVLMGKDEKAVIAELTASLILYQGGLADLVLVRDITEEQKILNALKESEEKYRTLFENANDAIFLMEGDTFVDCNRATLKMFGCEYEDIIGKKPWEFSPPKQPDGSDSAEKAIEYIRSALSGKPQRFYWKHIKKSGEPVDTEVSLSSFTAGGGRFILAIVRDVTERLRWEKTLKESEEKYRTLFENALNTIIIGDLNGRILEINRAIEDYGLKREEIVGRSIFEMFPERYHRMLRSSLRQLSKGEPSTGEITFETPRGDGHR